MKKIVLSIALMAAFTGIKAQENSTKPFSHMDLGVILGTTGVGFDVQMPVHDIVKLRAGFEFMPRFTYNMHFDVESFDSEGIPTGASLDRMSELLHGFTGYQVSQSVTMKGKPTMWNFKFLVDVYPFKNKHWHVTAGFHWGPSKIAEAVNAQEDAPSLVAIGMYNHLWECAYYDIPIAEIEGIGEIALGDKINQRLVKMGRMGIPVGKYKDNGATYYMEPNENAMVYAKAYTNSFKPYLGFGYEGRLIKGNDKYHIGFDAGAMFWGGTPSIITHDGTNLSKDVKDINGKIGTYVDLVKAFKVFPVLNLRITRTIF